MAEKIGDLKVSEFLEKLAAPEADYGGGSAVLFGAAMGAGLASMAIGITLKRGGSENEEELRKKAVSFKELSAIFLDMASLDGQAYADYLKARRMAQESEEEKKARGEAMLIALRRSVELPMQACDLCVKLLEDIRGLKDKCAQCCHSDLSAAVSLLRDCASGCLVNVIQNSAQLADPAAVMPKVKELSLKIKLLSLDILVNK